MMTDAEMTRTLLMHGVEYTWAFGKLWMLDIWRENSRVWEMRWIPVKRNRIELYSWLGY